MQSARASIFDKRKKKTHHLPYFKPQKELYTPSEASIKTGQKTGEEQEAGVNN